VVRQLVQPVAPSSVSRPQANIAHQDNRWWRMSQYDSAVVSNAEGTGASWYKRNPQQLRKMLAESTRLHAMLLKDWHRLSAEYKAAAKEISSFEAWKKTFERHSESGQ
jgi:galactofuranosylgalactofuranosylrhamnosyl-N-acetylglucosaminyl-diphospho-decaprenol beta-1,5/1,6-galactofuranosyltransferase